MGRTSTTQTLGPRWRRCSSRTGAHAEEATSKKQSDTIEGGSSVSSSSNPGSLGTHDPQSRDKELGMGNTVKVLWVNRYLHVGQASGHDAPALPEGGFRQGVDLRSGGR